MKIKTKTVL